MTSRRASPAPRGDTLLAKMLLVLSAAALPLGWLLLRRSERGGALAVEVGCAILFARDLTMVITGAPARLRQLPRVLLFTELATAGTAVAAGWRGWVRRPVNEPARTATCAAACAGNLSKNPAITRLCTITAAATFIAHTVRLAIYVSPGRGYAKTPQSQPNLVRGRETADATHNRLRAFERYGRT